MSSLVSSMIHYSEVRPDVSFSAEEVSHELEHLKIRERVSGAIAIAGTVLAVVVLAGLLGWGQVIFGALAAISLIAGVYAYFCRQAESSLKARQMTLQPEGVQNLGVVPSTSEIQESSKVS